MNTRRKIGFTIGSEYNAVIEAHNPHSQDNKNHYNEQKSKVNIEVPEHVKIFMEVLKPILTKPKNPFSVCPEHLRILVETAMEWVVNESEDRYIFDDTRINRVKEKAKAARLMYGHKTDDRRSGFRTF